MRIDELLDTRVEKTPNKPFLNVANERFTYQETAAEAKRYANAFADIGVEAGDRVGLFLPNCPEFLFCLFANAYVDSVTVPSNPEYTSNELRHSLELSSPVVLVTTSTLLETVVEAASDTSIETILTTDPVDEYESLSDLAAGRADRIDPPAGDEKTVGLHMYTSGTTGPPKAVACQHQNWTVSGIDFQKRMGFTHDDTLLTALPLFHANAQIYSTLGAAAAGAEVVIEERFSSSRWWDWCREYDVTEFNAMGSMLKMLDNCPETDKDAGNPVEVVFSAGTPADLIEPFEERFGLQVVEGYSLTEDPLLILNPRDHKKRQVGSIGLPPAEKRIRIVDEDGTSVPPGERGEITMACPALMAGYYDQPKKTEEAIVDGWFYTGDYGKIDENGFVYFLDRKKDIVRRGGENISSYEVEGAIKSLASVEEVAVIPSPDEYYDEVVKALVRVKEGDDLAPMEVIEHCRGQIAAFKLPRYIEFTEEFPYTPTGKIRKETLRDRERETDPNHWDREADNA